MDNLIEVERPKFESGKYVLYIHCANVDMSVGTYGSDLGTFIKRIEYTNKMKAWGDYLMYKKQINNE